MSDESVMQGAGPARGLTRVLASLLALACLSTGLVAQAGSAAQTPLSQNLSHEAPPPADSPLTSLRHATIRLPLASVLAAALAFRPRRRGTPPRKAPVIQTQIILAIVGAVVMLVVGASLARAFGIVGAAGLIRYRAKIDDPKDAGVMLSTLAIGLASGVGLYALAGFTTAFILAALWAIESFEPESYKVFTLKITTPDPIAHRDQIESLLRRSRISYELRTSSQEEISYEVKLPLERKTDRVSNAILRLDPAGKTDVEWEEKKDKK